MGKFPKNIVVLLVGVFVGGSVMGATIYGGTKPGAQFEIASNWSSRTLPGKFEDLDSDGIEDDFKVFDEENIHIYGYVKLTGNLNLLEWSNLYIESDAILIIDGDLIISDKCDIYLYSKSTLYVTGNLNVINKTPSYSYVMFDMIISQT